ncbi:MAG: T9SS type A sorting domain-containing protein [Gemmatimonadota bacterium]|nr:MAG: T9SS type A sorting domain-containing protein [Gemmatimonadota bacterium]
MKIKSKVLFVLCVLAGFSLLLGCVVSETEARTKGSVTSPMSQAKPTGEQGLQWYASETGQIHNIGALWTCVSNHGIYGNANFQWPNFEWPGGSENGYNWEGRFWCGALVDGEDVVSHADYGNYEFYPVANSGPLFTDPSGVERIAVNYISGSQARGILDSYVEYDDKESILGHTPLNVRVLQRGLTWSMPDYDDIIAFELKIINEGTKDYENFYAAWIFDADNCQLDVSDPHIDDLVDFDGWDGSQYTDRNDSRTDELPEVPPGLPFNRGDIVDPFDWDGDKITGYDEWGVPYGDPDNPNYDEGLVEPDGFPDEYTLLLAEDFVNSVAQLRGQRIAFKHPDVQDSIVVYGFAVPRNMSYIYDGDHQTTPENDFQERAQVPYPCDGYIGGRLIYTGTNSEVKKLPVGDKLSAYYNYSGPPTQEDSTVYTLSDSLMMPYCHSWWNWESDPGSDTEKLEYMDGRHVAMKGKRYMVNPHHSDFNAPVFDYRWLQSTGPFDFNEGDTLSFVYAVAVGRGLEGVRKHLDTALLAYYEGSTHSDPYHPSCFDCDNHWVLPAPPLVPVLNYSAGNRKVTLVWDNVAEGTPDVKDNLLDFRGYKIYRSLYKPAGWELIYAYDNVDDSVAVWVTGGDTLKDETGNPILVDLPSIPPDHQFCDPESLDSIEDADGNKTYVTPWGNPINPPLNGLPYYYSIVAYDFGRQQDVHGVFLPPQESSRSNYKTDPETGGPSGVVPVVYYEEGDPTPSVDSVKVVPNPYLGTAKWERQYHDKIMFINLPPVCKISIFTLTGDLVYEIYHDQNSSFAGADSEEWDLISRNDQSVVSGLYLYVVETPNEKRIDKFVILMAE